MKLKKIIALICTFAMTASMLTGCGSSKKSSQVLNIYNVGDYIDQDLLAKFTEQTGIEIVYETYDTNEAMYQKLKSGSSKYDLIFPSDYMVDKLIEENMLQKIDYKNIPNYSQIMDSFKHPSYDPNDEYSVPYLWGTFGIIYNTKVVDKEDTKSWDILWNKKYTGNILLLDSVRDTMGISLKRLGYSMNTHNPDEINKAKDELIKELSVVQAYVNDDGKDRIIAGDADIGIVYSGDALVMMDENPDLAYAIPEEGTNKWVDAMCIPKTAENKDYAEAFINFMLDPEVAKQNVDYIEYSTPNQGVYDMLDEETKNSLVAYPSEKVLNKTEVFLNLPENVMKLYDDAWTEIKTN